MENFTSYTVIFSTVSSKEEAKKITNALLEEKLAACVNILPSIESFFWWEGKIDTANEMLLIIKTLEKNIPFVTKRIKELHSYKVPEVIAVSIIGGNKDYLRWIGESIAVLSNSKTNF
ncbi:MAG: divalent-cation tolerance protein CutA [bacterium]|nr:divalent-cation tolerance protein CutA [bacterium]